MPWMAQVLFLMFGTIAEVVLANYGLAIPLLGVGAFYFTMRHGAPQTLPGFLTAAAMTDACWMHHFPSQVVMVLIVVGCSSAWRPYGDVNSGLSLALAGCCIGVIAWLARVMGMLAAANFSKGGFYLLQILGVQVFVMIVITPLLALSLNRLLRRSVTWLSAIEEEDD